MTLYLSRKLRFADAFADRYKRLFRLDERGGLSILEVGCGPGALAEALKRWYPGGQITGIDRDSRFVAFAKEHHPDYAVVAPDDPLVMGLVDRLNEKGFKTFGPRANAAILEGSKVFSKGDRKSVV